jgi:hypothetical protein
LSTFAQGDPIHGTRTHGNNISRTRYKRRRTTVIELESNGGSKKGVKGKTTKHGDGKGAAKERYKKATKGEENHDDSEDSSSRDDSEDTFSQDDSEDIDFYGEQTNAPKNQPSHEPNSDLSSLSLSKKTDKTSKKRKKSKKDDSHKNSSKLSKKSKMSSSKAPGEFLF